MKLPKTSHKETPPGKRAVRVNVWGNVVGYVGGRRFWEFGTNEPWNIRDAEKWAAGASLNVALGVEDDEA